MRARDRDGLATHARLVAPALVVLTLAATAGPDVSLNAQVALALGLTLLLGIPHGALDHETLKARLSPHLGRGYLPLFVAAYLAVAGATLASWLSAPALALVAFLGISTVHFGLSDEKTSGGESRSLVRILSRGLLPIALPGVLHAHQIAPVYEALLFGHATVSVELVQRLSMIAGAGALAAAFGTLEPGRARDGALSVRMTALAALSACLLFAPPLMAFALYFCGWHALRETLDLAASRAGAQLRTRLANFVASAWPFSLAASIGFLAALAWSYDEGSWTGEARVLFVGLASLTVPHMIVETIGSLGSAPRTEGRGGTPLPLRGGDARAPRA